jgi:hypothetical protein
MKNKKNILLASVLAIFVLLIFFVYTDQKDKPAIIESKQITKNVGKKDTIKFSGNVVKLGFKKENITNNNKNTSLEKRPINNKVANDFLKNYANKKLTFQKKIKILETMLIHEPSFWGNHNELYNLIVNEQDKRLVGELVAEFFSLYARPYNGELPNPTSEERVEISNLVKKLIENPLTRDRSLARTNILLNNDEVQNMYQELKHQLNEEEQQGLLDSYIDGMILDGKNPTSEGFNEVGKYLPKEEIKKRTQNLLGFMSKFTEGKDTSSWDNDFIRKH